MLNTMLLETSDLQQKIIFAFHKENYNASEEKQHRKVFFLNKI